MSRRSRHAFRPTCTNLEDRVALSLSFSGLMHSLFPFIKSNDNATPKRPANQRLAHVATAHPTMTAHQAALARHAARLAANSAADVSDPNSAPNTRSTMPPTVILAGRLARSAAVARQTASAAVASRMNGGVH